MCLTTVCLSLLLAQAPPPQQAESCTMRSRLFEIPINLTPGRSEDIDRLRLWVSRDKGLTWARVSTVPPTRKAFRFDAPADGLYWFAVQVIEKNGKVCPKQVRPEDVGLKVLVETDPARREARKPPKPLSDREMAEALRKELSELKARQKELERRLAEYEKRLPQP